MNITIMIVTHIGALTVGALLAAMRARHRRTRDMMTGYGAGVNVTVAGSTGRMDICRCRHRRQIHTKTSSDRVGGICLAQRETDTESSKTECGCQRFVYWCTTDEYSVCECGSTSFRDVTVCLDCGRWQ